MPVKFEIKDQLAKLLATEDLVVEHKDVSTASFNVDSRVLILPNWNKASNNVYDMLVGHEVGHALYTPNEDISKYSAPLSYINVTEDARIEKLIKRKFPGLSKNFYKGYWELNEQDFFELEGVELEELALIDRINLYYKGNTEVQFSDDEKIFVEKAKSILNESRILNRRQTLLENGNQTSGNIFDIKNYDTNEIQNIIRTEVEKYRERFKKSEEGLIKKMPTEYSLYGWLISMKSGGNLKPHIHTEGWLSGSIYINVPQKLKVNSGNLVVSLGEDNDAIDARINEKKTINVVTGSMVLFPASLMHYTIPFESEEERIVLAFDVKGKS